jgi:hypothetical protein
VKMMRQARPRRRPVVSRPPVERRPFPSDTLINFLALILGLLMLVLMMMLWEGLKGVVR